MFINIEKVPFTRKGGYLAISKDPMYRGGGIWLRSLIRPEWGTGRKKASDHLFRFLPITGEGTFVDGVLECSPWEMKIKSQHGGLRYYFSSDDTLVILSDKLGVVLEHDDDEIFAVNQAVTSKSFKAFFPVIDYSVEIKVESGSIKYDGNHRRVFVTPDKNKCVITIKASRKGLESSGESVQTIMHEEAIESIRKDYERFVSNYQLVNEHVELAAYILWSTEYSPKGHITRRCNAISKSLMNLVWSWDNCFNALGVAQGDSELAWGNIFLFFDLQQEDGMLPDAVNPAAIVNWYTKPPVHGFTVKRLLEQGHTLPKKEKEKLYEGLKKWTMWWYNKLSRDGLIYYKHPFDSGWDNATCFDQGSPLATPDVNAYLVIQQDVLAELAAELGLSKEAKAWKKQADLLLDQMLGQLWNGTEFLCKNESGETITTTSLMKMMPLVLGNRLPEDIRKALVAELSIEDHFLTHRGLATESVRSPLYDHRKGDPAKPNAYWRGPIWPPVLYLIVCGLRDAGESELANVIAERYAATIESNEGAMYENYDALTGAGNDDPSYVWTSAVYLLLKNQ